MKKLLLILGIACLIALPATALAADKPVAKPVAKDMAQRLKAADAYWQLTHTHTRIIETLQRVSTRLPPDKQKTFMERAHQFFGKKRMAAIKKQWLAMAAQVFTADELKALVDFYGSKRGMAIRDKMPKLLEGNAKVVGGELTAFIRVEQERMAKEAAAAQKQKAPAAKEPPKKK